MSFISPLFFCKPEQVLVFLTIFGALLGAFQFAKDIKKIKFEKVLKRWLYLVSAIIYFPYLWALEYTNIILVLVLTIIYFLIIIVSIEKKKWNILYLVLIIMISYFLAGATENACLFFPPQDRNEYNQLVNRTQGEEIHILTSSDLVSKVHCNVAWITLGEIKANGVFIRLSDNNNKTITTTWISENEALTVCTSQSKLVKIYDTKHIEWDHGYKIDIFLNVQGLFSTKGVYRNA